MDIPSYIPSAEREYYQWVEERKRMYCDAHEDLQRQLHRGESAFQSTLMHIVRRSYLSCCKTQMTIQVRIKESGNQTRLSFN